MPINLITDQSTGAKIKVVGIGGGGGNALNTMIEEGIEGVEFIAINTDIQALEKNRAEKKIQIGKNITKGLGTGMDDEKAKAAVEESREEIQEALRDSDMIFITAGMGGGTGTGASPYVANIARSMDALVVAIVTKPFNFELKPRITLAENGIEKLKKEVDSLIVIPNQKIVDEIEKKINFTEAFRLADRVLHNATKGISQIITKTGHINVDFADVRTIMKGTGDALIGTGFATGEDRAKRAAQEALTNKMLEYVNIKGAKSVLVNICSNGDATMDEIEEANIYISEKAGDQAKYIFGLVEDPELGDGLMITVIATGFDNSIAKKNAAENEMKESHPAQAQIHIFSKKSSINEIPSDSKLQDLNQPAVQRRGVPLGTDDDLGETYKPEEDKDLMPEDDDFNYKDLILNEDTIKPTFLRRQMD